MGLDLISKSLDFVDRDIKKSNYQSSVKNKKGKNDKNKVKRISAVESIYDEGTGEIIKGKCKRKKSTDISNLLSSKKARKGECLIDQYRTACNDDRIVREDELNNESDNFEDELDIDDVNTVVKFVFEESNNRKKALKTLDRSQHGRKRVPMKTNSNSIFKDSDFKEVSKKNNTIILNSKAKKLTSEEEIKKALGIRR